MIANQVSGQNSQSQSNTQAGPGGIAQSQSSSQSSYSETNVMQTFQPVVSTLNTLQGMMGNGGLTMPMASQYMGQIAGQLQSALSAVNTCNCIGGSNVSSMLTNMFSQLYQVLTGMQSTFGANSMGSILSSFGQLAPTMSQFTQQSRSAQSFSSIAQSLNPMVSMLAQANPAFNNVLP
ncbi:hypothetical protein PGT21_002479 [Puccinia graminis f. sp. tritici]|nr:hypothetical protein PGT21_002479 [Puccinia graminis f. sp. tritici]